MGAGIGEGAKPVWGRVGKEDVSDCFGRIL
jgi:hypothetical protein